MLKHVGCTAAILVSLFTVACGQDQPPQAFQAPSLPPYVPVVLDQETFFNLVRALGELRYKEAMPILNYLNSLEDRAQTQARAAQGKK